MDTQDTRTARHVAEDLFRPPATKVVLHADSLYELDEEHPLRSASRRGAAEAGGAQDWTFLMIFSRIPRCHRNRQ